MGAVTMSPGAPAASDGHATIRTSASRQGVSMKKRTLVLLFSLMLLATTGGHSATASGGRALDPDFFDIFFRHAGLVPQIQMGRFTFHEPLWQFGDRAGYRCAWAFLMDGGVPVARVQFDRGAAYTAVIDKFGPESNNDMSQCHSFDGLETKPKPAGLADTIVDFKNASGTLDSITFPAISGEDSLSWWELEEADADEVEIELYWQSDVAVIATITSLSPSLTFSTRSSAPPQVGTFSPVSGGPGTQVTITGANFVGVNSVTFGGVAAPYEVHSAGEIVATVPEGAPDGAIAVSTPTGTGTSGTNFTVGGTVAHLSKVTLKLSGHLVASGSVSSVDGTAACVGGRTVVIQRRVSGKWTNRGQDQTDDTGVYRKKIKNKKGLYRALVRKATLSNGEECSRDLSFKKRVS